MSFPNPSAPGGKLSLFEKISYALGDGAANIAWRGVSTFLLIFYTDVFGLGPAIVGTLMLIVRLSDGISDVVMGAVCDRTNTRWGKFRPWVLWTALPLAVILSLMFTCPDWDMSGKIVYAYATYILFTLIYTANNIPYGSLMAVMTPDDKERTSLGSFRMVGAFAGGMLVQGLLLFLVAYFGNVDPKVSVEPAGKGEYTVTISSPQDVSNLSVTTRNGVADLYCEGLKTPVSDDDGNAVVDASGNQVMRPDTPTKSKSFSAQKDHPYVFSVSSPQEVISSSSFYIVDQSKGYSKAIYILSAVLALCMLVTFYGTKERVAPPSAQKNNFGSDLSDLVRNKPWIVLVLVGLLFNIYNNTKQGITVIYFTHYLHNQLLSAGYMTGLMVASILGAMATAPLSRILGKKRLFIFALLFSCVVNSLIYLCGPGNVSALFVTGMVSEAAAAIFPTLFFAMLGDVADYSEFANHRRATGLVYSAGSFATKFGGGLAGALIGFVLGAYGYQGQDAVAIQGALEGIKGLMSWIPALLCVAAAAFMLLYPLGQDKMEQITAELAGRRKGEKA